jgi:hypothetical protein
MKWGGGLALAAGMLMGLPQPAMAGQSGVLWVGLCDAAHPGTQIPIPLNRDGDRGPGKACHAGCGLLSDRRARR